MGILNSGNMLGRIGSLLAGAASGIETRLESDRQQARADTLDARNWTRQLDMLGRQQGFQSEQARLGREYGVAQQLQQQGWKSRENELARRARQEEIAAQQRWEDKRQADQNLEWRDRLEFQQKMQTQQHQNKIAPAIDEYASQMKDADRKYAAGKLPQREYDQITGQLRGKIAEAYSGIPVQANVADMFLAGNMPSPEALKASGIPGFLQKNTMMDQHGNVVLRPGMLEDADADTAWSRTVGKKYAAKAERPWYMQGVINEKGGFAWSMLPDVEKQYETYTRLLETHRKTKSEAEKGYLERYNTELNTLTTSLHAIDVTPERRKQIQENIDSIIKKGPEKYSEPEPRNPLDETDAGKKGGAAPAVTSAKPDAATFDPKRYYIGPAGRIIPGEQIENDARKEYAKLKALNPGTPLTFEMYIPLFIRSKGLVPNTNKER